MRCRPVKHCYSAAVSARRVHNNDAVPSRPVGVDSVSDLGLLKYAHVHVGLGHTPQHQLQYPVTSITNVVGAETNCYPLPRRTPGNPTHPPPTDALLSPDPADLPTCACLPLCRYRYRSSPVGFPFTLTSLLPSTFSPLRTLCRSPRNGVLRSDLTQGKQRDVEVTVVASHRTNFGFIQLLTSTHSRH